MCLLGVANSAARWAVLAELGAKSHQFYWIKALVKSQEAILRFNSPLLAEVAKADVALASDALPRGQRCSTRWSAELAVALNS